MPRTTAILGIAILLTGCGGGGGETTPAPAPAAPQQNAAQPAAPAANAAAPVDTADATPASALDTELRALIADENLTIDPTMGRDLPQITDPMANLGMALFYSTNLGGQQDAACVSCHHPVLGGSDALSLPVGVDAVDVFNVPDQALLGPGRHAAIAGAFPLVPRNAPTTFNIGLWDNGLFWDSRIRSLSPQPGQNGSAGNITTPDSGSGADTTLPAGTTLAAAQARFPVTSEAEMRGGFAAGEDNASLRSSLATRFTDSAWADMFVLAFGDDEISFDRIAEAIGEYERSQVFVDSPWHAYLAGNNEAISEDAKEGAVLFFTGVNDGGAGCSRCHNGDLFSDERHHIVAFPQVGDDAGREDISGDAGDRYHFRTPSLLNIAVTAPYGHAGLYQSLEESVRHYVNPRGAIDRLFGEQGGEVFVNANPPVCQLPQVSRMISASGESCETLMASAWENSQLVLDRLGNDANNNDLGRRPNLSNGEVMQIVAFLEVLTDPCVEDRECLDAWIIDADDLGDYPDGRALVGRDEEKRDY